jgi:2,4-dienoyl-CoA reductase-like NADH-dependent reductase (Old Yellow Enzyme family)
VKLDMDFGGKRFAKPRAMEKKDLERVIEGFVSASEYASKAGWDGVQLHGAQ